MMIAAYQLRNKNVCTSVYLLSVLSFKQIILLPKNSRVNVNGKQAYVMK